MPKIPDCYDPVVQEERRQEEWDDFVDNLPICSCCEDVVLPGHIYSEYMGIILCDKCLAALNAFKIVLEDY